MARFYGEVGYGISTEDVEAPGAWVDRITEMPYQGDVIRAASNLEFNQKVNNDVALSNSISIVADQFAIENFYNIKYIRWSGVLWTVNSVEVRRPRLILNLGNVYNGPTPILVAPNTPDFSSETGELNITDQIGVIYKNSNTNEVINNDGSPYLIDSETSITVVAIPELGYYFNGENTEWVFTAD